MSHIRWTADMVQPAALPLSFLFSPLHRHRHLLPPLLFFHSVHPRPTHGLAPQFHAVASLLSPPRLFFLPPPGFVMQLFLLQAKREPDSWELVVWARRSMDGQAVLPVAMPAGRVF
ncbi:uncharacterized protein TrAtP1_006388 [Trichoderma atroviride]|uniref:uncharacterized protein n=1 Tax=Hypocrea atroviridis TaxID=63577 RepID=UPI00331CDF1F|nr:hypothetical protein TrAtP1_006388 [Trichoderma atroviride]